MMLIFAMYAISASTFLLAKQLLACCSPLFLVGIRTFFAGIFFLFTVVLTKKQNVQNMRKFLFPCLSIAFYSFFVSNTLKFWALHFLSPLDAAIISVIEPFCAMFIAYVMFNEDMSVTKWIGMICCMASGFVMASEGSLLAQARVFNDGIIPALAMCVAVGASAYGALLMRKVIKYDNASPMLILGMSMTIAGIAALLSTCMETSSCTVTSVTMVPFVYNLALLILLSNIIAYSIYGQLLKRHSVLLISCGSFIKPLAIICYRALLLHEFVPWYAGYSALVLMFGLLIIYFDELASFRADAIGQAAKESL